ncbi:MULTISPECIES: alpha/beta hydrolase fold domain-containing protein [Nocardia]|uniref:alpha/beta hydrolase fold domain-containing protein n=1 Tax=Nocardia TaxID=1817 RepID=UPI001893273A|nr:MULTISPECIES: alpha/beta hydrolase fold domain-containing protein [Nocardia]MBF6347945.1 alpha/beta hydrolase fold domain-containing protein [Nocardia flavorosea]
MLPPERYGMPATADLRARRAQFTAGESDESATATEVCLGSVPCRVLGGGAGATVLYLHGGGYRMGSAAAYSRYGARIARTTGAEVVLADYRLAPESPFPAAVRDAVSVYLELRNRRPGRPIVVAGDSAGGGLAAAVAVAAARIGVAGPEGMALLSPWLDLRCDAPSYTSATDALFDRTTAVGAREAYLQGHDGDDPLVSPLRADPGVFPPALIQVGTTETLLDDSVAFTGRLAAAGVSCRLEIMAGRGHTWPLIEPDHPDSGTAVETFGEFVRRLAGSARRRGA